MSHVEAYVAQPVEEGAVDDTRGARVSGAESCRGAELGDAKGAHWRSSCGSDGLAWHQDTATDRVSCFVLASVRLVSGVIQIHGGDVATHNVTQRGT